MSELEKPNVRSKVYRLEEKDQTVATAKSQFSEEYDVPYSNIKGTIIINYGTGWGKRPSICVVSEIPK